MTQDDMTPEEFMFRTRNKRTFLVTDPAIAQRLRQQGGEREQYIDALAKHFVEKFKGNSLSVKPPEPRTESPAALVGFRMPWMVPSVESSAIYEEAQSAEEVFFAGRVFITVPESDYLKEDVWYKNRRPVEEEAAKRFDLVIQHRQSARQLVQDWVPPAWLHEVRPEGFASQPGRYTPPSP